MLRSYGKEFSYSPLHQQLVYAHRQGVHIGNFQRLLPSRAQDNATFLQLRSREQVPDDDVSKQCQLLLL